MAEQLPLIDEHACDFEQHIDRLVIRESRRARRLSFRHLPPNVIELVVPAGTRPRAVQSFVNQHRAWIDKLRREIRARHVGGRQRLPSTVDLRAIGRCFDVTWRHNPDANAQVRQGDGALEIECPDATFAGGPDLMREWLLGIARIELKDWLERTARRMDAHPSRVQVRLQKTRWGSCSARATVSLNASLLFLDPALVDYLMIHELAHLRVMSHSRRFWAEVGRFEADYERLDRRLAKSWTQIPFWVVAK